MQVLQWCWLLGVAVTRVRALQPLTPDSDVQRYAMLVVLAGIIVGFITVGMLHLLKKNYVTFADRRKLSYMEYTQRLFRSSGLSFRPRGRAAGGAMRRASGTPPTMLAAGIVTNTPQQDRLAQVLAQQRWQRQIAEQRASYMWYVTWRTQFR